MRPQSHPRRAVGAGLAPSAFPLYPRERVGVRGARQAEVRRHERRDMSEEQKPEALTKAIKLLTVAVWCLCAAVVGQVAYSAWAYTYSMRWTRQMASTSTTSVTSKRSKEFDSPPIQWESLHDLPPEQMVAKASVILLTSYEDVGDRYKAVVAEVLKQDPGVELYYSVGDELPHLSFAKERGQTCGEGQVVFMTGNPASMSSSYGITNGRIGGLGDISLTTLREMVKKGKK
jgi:hypothetical protein